MRFRIWKKFNEDKEHLESIIKKELKAKEDRMKSRDNNFIMRLVDAISDDPKTTTGLLFSVSASLSGHLFSTVLSSTIKSIDPNFDDRNRFAQKESNESSLAPSTSSATNNNHSSSTSIKWQEDGPLPLISDSVFSLIILIYVGVIFVFMFFSFCWKEPEPPPPDPAHKNIPMITTLLEEMERKEAALRDVNGSSTAHLSSSMKQGTEMTLMKPEIIAHPELISSSSSEKGSDEGEFSNSESGRKEDGSAVLAATCV
ncbi:unnamed protein product [Lepeophtheirus salmonis]|uniref:(salmon louse) hypothetical protein n=1 Tax=Lepeophtheirus salmonis TaxID=72036 RepID=A0A7R8CYX8_LEPSM|nr:unnamed protein product [Lepeophtheirus salmonis]CAF2928279.1 unnamed protein product [Lepeophtheirus salmonis]